MHATNVLASNPQGDDGDSRSPGAGGDNGYYENGKRRNNNHMSNNDKNENGHRVHLKEGHDQKKQQDKKKAGFAAPYTPYEDAVYYGGGKDEKNDRRRNSRHQEEYAREFDPDERVVEERWRRRRRWTRGEEDEADEDFYTGNYDSRREDPYDPESNMRYDRKRLQYDPSEDELRRERYEEYSNGGRSSERDEKHREKKKREARTGVQQQKDHPLQSFFPLPLPQNHGPKKDGRGRKIPEEVLEEFDDEKGVHRRGKSRRRHSHSSDEDSYYDGHDHRYERESKSDDGRSRARSRSTRNRRSSRSRSISRRRKVAPADDPYKPEEKYTIAKAAKAAAWIAAVETWRCRKEEGPWTGQKGRRILLASSVGVIIGALRNGRLLDAGMKPYADSAMTGFYGIDFLKRVAKHTEHEKGALKEQAHWREEAEGRAPWQLPGKERAYK